MSEKDSRPALELGSATLHGNGSSTGTYYKVEFRNTSSMPKVIGDGQAPFPFVIDNYWRTLPIRLGATKWGANIPTRSWDSDAAEHGLSSYVVAEAHRWAFLAALEAGAAGVGGTLCIETRLVAVKFRRTFSTEEIGVSQAMGHAYEPAEIAPRHPATAGIV